ncbi:ATP-binding protein [Marinifilum sp. D714]|uniref:PAS domain-containing sensor histidine kinase n=1 Tax=Marinifilum sp. D714 TaxID=2937523 RepID=UPI0027C6EEBF|nr:ATP-binding protein [Marinifilum sp. D714]MDQ2178778.1 histidine kinase [Marinifilum sp. D714]
MKQKIHNDSTKNLLSSVVKNAPYGMIAIDNFDQIVLVNDQAVSLLKLDAKPNELNELVIFDQIKHIEQLHLKLNQIVENQYRDFNLEALPFDDKFLNIRGRKIVEGYIVTIEDITRDKEMEMVALNSMLEGQELERTRIAKEIHDGIGPSLSTIRLLLENLSSENNRLDNAKFSGQVSEILDMIDSLTGDIRDISHQLMPKILLDFGIIPALENLVNRINRAERIKIILFHSILSDRFPELIELGLYRICQELINNSVKHSSATEVQVQLIEHPESLILMVEDNGKGFDKTSVMKENPGVGLINVESRTNAFGGNFILDTAISKGVTATIEIPLEK